MRILLLYVYGWSNYYYDQVVIVLTTFDPLINHCVCLWIMRKYRDGYASSMGSLVSCFKISDDGIWATTITRLSTMSRRSTYSRASTRSSTRQPSKRKNSLIMRYLLLLLSNWSLFIGGFRGTESTKSAQPITSHEINVRPIKTMFNVRPMVTIKARK